METSLLAEYLSQYQSEFSEENATFDELASRWSVILMPGSQIISPDGTVPGYLSLHIHGWITISIPPEIQQALSDGFGRSIRYSRTEGKEFMYTVIPGSPGRADCELGQHSNYRPAGSI